MVVVLEQENNQQVFEEHVARFGILPFLTAIFGVPTWMRGSGTGTETAQSTSSRAPRAEAASIARNEHPTG